MGRILAIDYGEKRIGIAASDPLKIIANAIDTVETTKIFDFLMSYCSKNECEKIIVGYPKKLNNQPADITAKIDLFIKKLETIFPRIIIIKYDERFTSKIAFNTMIECNIGKKRRRDKSLIDKISATIILQDYMERIRD